MNGNLQILYFNQERSMAWHALKDLRVMLTILLSTLVFYPGLMIGITYFQEQNVEDVQSSIPEIVIKGVDHQKVEKKFTPTPFKVTKVSNAKKALLNDKIEGILKLSINGGTIDAHYQYKANSSKSSTSYKKIKQWFSLIEKKQKHNFINELNNVDTRSLNIVIVIVFVGMVSSIIGKEGTELELSFLPIVSNVLSIKGILIDKTSIAFVSFSILTTFLYTVVLLVVFIQLFKKEKYTLG